jgi:hypothetical protein
MRANRGAREIAACAAPCLLEIGQIGGGCAGELM